MKGAIDRFVPPMRKIDRHPSRVVALSHPVGIQPPNRLAGPSGPGLGDARMSKAARCPYAPDLMPIIPRSMVLPGGSGRIRAGDHRAEWRVRR